MIFVTGSLADGGAEKVMSILASGCAELGADVTLVVLRPKKIVYPVSDKVKIVQFTDDGKLATIKTHKKAASGDERISGRSSDSVSSNYFVIYIDCKYWIKEKSNHV